MAYLNESGSAKRPFTAAISGSLLAKWPSEVGVFFFFLFLLSNSFFLHLHCQPTASLPSARPHAENPPGGEVDCAHRQRRWGVMERQLGAVRQ